MNALVKARTMRRCTKHLNAFCGTAVCIYGSSTLRHKRIDSRITTRL